MSVGQTTMYADKHLKIEREKGRKRNKVKRKRLKKFINSWQIIVE
jgi:hypothetical protein